MKIIGSVTGTFRKASLAMKAGDDIWDILDLRSEATTEEIKFQYRKLVKEFHPDTLTALGYSEEVVQRASDYLKTVNAAYAKAKKLRKF